MRARLVNGEPRRDGGGARRRYVQQWRGREKVDKNCEDCGVLLVNVDPHRKLCYECSKKRARAYQREHQKEYREYYQNYKKKRIKNMIFEKTQSYG